MQVNINNFILHKVHIPFLIGILSVHPQFLNPFQETRTDRYFHNASTELICVIISQPKNVALNWTRTEPYIKSNYITTSEIISGEYYYDLNEVLRSSLYFNLSSMKNSCSEVEKFDGSYTCMVTKNNVNLLNSSAYIVNSLCKLNKIFIMN